MGQQQLLLIVLGVIIVGIAVVVGINLFNANSRESWKSQKATQVMNYAQMYLTYYKKTKAMGGGGRSFAGLKPPGDENWETVAAGYSLHRPNGAADLPVWLILGFSDYAYVRYISTDIYYDNNQGNGNYYQHIYIVAYVYPTEIVMQVSDTEI